MRPVLVILAAGASERLGQCKALARLGGRSVLERLLEAGRGVDGGRALLVAGPHARELSAAAPPGCEVIENADWRAGRTGSVARARSARPGRDLLLAPVDVPLIPERVFQALAQRWDDLGEPEVGWLAPRLASADASLDGRHGHPVVVGRGLLDHLEALGPAAPLRKLRSRARPLVAVEVFDPEILDDLDGPDDLARLQERLLRAP